MIKIPSSKSNFEVVPAGSYVARCYRIICKGTQEVEWKKKIKHQFKILISFELPQRLSTPTEDYPEPRPMTVHGTFTLSLDPKSNLRGLLESWVGHEMDLNQAEMTGEIDLEALVGKPGYLAVTNNTDAKGNEWANIGTCQPLPEGFDCPEMVNEPKWFWLDESGEGADVFDSLSDSLQETIQKSPEYEVWAENRPAPKSDEELDEDLDSVMGTTDNAPDEDDIPF